VFIYLTPFKPLFGNLPPLSPSLHKGGGISYVREAKPLLHNSPYSIRSLKGEGEDIKKRGEAPLRYPLFGLVDGNEFRVIK